MFFGAFSFVAVNALMCLCLSALGAAHLHEALVSRRRWRNLSSRLVDLEFSAQPSFYARDGEAREVGAKVRLILNRDLP